MSSASCQRALPLLHRSYGLMRQSNTLPSYSVPLIQRVFAGSHQSLLDIGPSRCYLHKSFRRCLDPYPGGFPWCSHPFLPMETSAFSNLSLGSTFPPHSRKATSHGTLFSGLQPFRYVQTPTFARHPGRSYPIFLGSCDFYIRASHDSLPYHAPDMLNVRIGQLMFGGFHPIRSAALPAAPKGFRANL